jgi:hypothetical protein
VVACCLDIGGPETAAVHIVSITDLLFDRRSPLFRDIDTYPTPPDQETQAAARPQLLTRYIPAHRSEFLPRTDQMKRLFRVGS